MDGSFLTADSVTLELICTSRHTSAARYILRYKISSLAILAYSIALTGFTPFKLYLECHRFCHCNFPIRRTHAHKIVCLMKKNVKKKKKKKKKKKMYLIFSSFMIYFIHAPATHPQIIRMHFLLHDPWIIRSNRGYNSDQTTVLFFQ